MYILLLLLLIVSSHTPEEYQIKAIGLFPVILNSSNLSIENIWLDILSTLKSCIINIIPNVFIYYIL